MGSLFIIRHGQTTCNAQRIIQGPRIDAELSEIGHHQALALHAAFQDTPLGALYVSPMLRARQTATELAAGHAGLAVQVVPELYEMDYGDLCGHTVPEVQDVVDEVMDAWAQGFVDRPYPGGESPLVAQLRVRPFVERVLEQARDHAVAVVAHGRINRVLLATLTHASLQELDRFPQDNANISQLDVGPEVAVRRLNDTSHLDERTGAFS